MISEVFFDVETKKLFSEIQTDDPADLGISIVSLYTREVDQNKTEQNGQLQSFWENEFERMWNVFQKADRVVGYNSLGFDIPAISSYSPFPFHKLTHFDIMQKIKEVYGRRVSLNDVAKETLDREKIETGLEAVYLWQKGDKESLDRLKNYCEDDVLITKEIYDFVQKNEFVLFKDKWNTLRKIYLDFSYPKQDILSKQIDLF